MFLIFQYFKVLNALKKYENLEIKYHFFKNIFIQSKCSVISFPNGYNLFISYHTPLFQLCISASVSGWKCHWEPLEEIIAVEYLSIYCLLNNCESIPVVPPSLFLTTLLKQPTLKTSSPYQTGPFRPWCNLCNISLYDFYKLWRYFTFKSCCSNAVSVFKVRELLQLTDSHWENPSLQYKYTLPHPISHVYVRHDEIVSLLSNLDWSISTVFEIFYSFLCSIPYIHSYMSNLKFERRAHKKD